MFVLNIYLAKIPTACEMRSPVFKLKVNNIYNI